MPPATETPFSIWGSTPSIGDGHKEFAADKIRDTDFYILTLAGIARELRIMGLDSARVHLAAGLPLTWVSGQKDVFKSYLLQNDAADFTFRGRPYHVEFKEILDGILMQGLSPVPYGYGGVDCDAINEDKAPVLITGNLKHYHSDDTVMSVSDFLEQTRWTATQ